MSVFKHEKNTYVKSIHYKQSTHVLTYKKQSKCNFSFLILKTLSSQSLVGRGFVTNPGFERRFRWRGSVLS